MAVGASREIAARQIDPDLCGLAGEAPKVELRADRGGYARGRSETADYPLLPFWLVQLLSVASDRHLRFHFYDQLESSPDIGGRPREAGREPLAIVCDSLSWLRRPLSAGA